MSLEQRIRYRFYAEYGAPGFHEVDPVLAESREAAEAQARRHCSTPWKGWPRGRVEITILDWDAVALPDGRFLLREEYETEQRNAGQ